MKAAIVICGQMGSGKSTIAAFLASKLSKQVVSFGNYIRRLAQESGQPTTRDALQNLGQAQYQSLGATGLLHGVLHLAGVEEDQTVVFDGVRHTEVLAAIRRSAERTVAIYLEVSAEERYRRRRCQSSHDLSPEEFQSVEHHEVEAETRMLAELCDYVIDASRTLPDIQNILPSELFTLEKP